MLITVAAVVLQCSFHLTSLSLCDRALKPLPADHRYKADESIVVQVEARNVPNARSFFSRSYHLEKRLTITDAGGVVVDRDVQVTKSISDGPNEPFRFGYMRPLKRLKPGRYTLSVVLADVASGRTAGGAVRFVVAEDR